MLVLLWWWLCALQEPLLEGSAAPCVVINGSSCTFSFALDALEVITQISQDFIPSTKADKVRRGRRMRPALQRVVDTDPCTPGWLMHARLILIIPVLILDIRVARQRTNSVWLLGRCTHAA